MNRARAIDVVLFCASCSQCKFIIIAGNSRINLGFSSGRGGIHLNGDGRYILFQPDLKPGMNLLAAQDLVFFKQSDILLFNQRSEERRVGKEKRSARWWQQSKMKDHVV